MLSFYYGLQYIVSVLFEGETCIEVPAVDGGTNQVNVDVLETTREQQHTASMVSFRLFFVMNWQLNLYVLGYPRYLLH